MVQGQQQRRRFALGKGGDSMETLPIRVLLADDHTIVRSGVRALLSTEPDIEVVGEVGNGAEAVAQAETLRPDVILMDLVMPGLSGIEATRQITASLPGTRVLVLTSFAADENVFPAIKAGAPGIFASVKIVVVGVSDQHKTGYNQGYSEIKQAACDTSCVKTADYQGDFPDDFEHLLYDVVVPP